MHKQKAASISHQAPSQSYFSDLFASMHPGDGRLLLRTKFGYERWTDLSHIVKDGKSIQNYRNSDLFFSFATYKKGKDGHMKRDTAHLCNIYAWSIDVDYEDDSKHPLDIYEYIMDNVSLPAPNYVEYGHRLRMIYIFEEPLRLYSKQRDKLLKGFRFLQKCMAKKINDTLDGMGAESTPPTSFFRMPGSVNTKTGDIIQVKHITDEKWTLQEMFSEWIPERYIDEFGLGKDYKKKKKKDKKKAATDFNSTILWKRRMRIFEEMQNLSNPPRKRLCFLYGVGLLWTHQANSSEEAMRGILEFNKGFLHPLPEKVIRSKMRTIHAYKYRDSELAAFLGVEASVFGSLSRKERDHERYLAKKKKQGYYRDYLKDRLKFVEKELKKGTSLEIIALYMEASISTIKRDVAKIRAEWKHLSKIRLDMNCRRKAFYKKYGPQEENTTNTAGPTTNQATPLQNVTRILNKVAGNVFPRQNTAVDSPNKKCIYNGVGYGHSDPYIRIEPDLEDLLIFY